MAEVELPKPEEIEELKSNTFTRRVALTTAIFAVMLAIASLGGSNATKDMMLAQQQSADQWAHYQAKNIRGHATRLQRLRLEQDLAERGLTMPPEARQKCEALLAEFLEEEAKYNREKREIEEKARELERERDVSRAKDPFFDYGEVLLQIAIVMSSVAILSSSRRMFGFSLAIALLGLLLTLNGYFLILGAPAAS